MKKATEGSIWRNKENGRLTTVSHDKQGTVMHRAHGESECWLLASHLFYEWYEPSERGQKPTLRQEIIVAMVRQGANEYYTIDALCDQLRDLPPNVSESDVDREVDRLVAEGRIIRNTWGKKVLLKSTW